MIRLAMLERDVTALSVMLRDAEPHESGAFLLLREGQGAEGRRLLATELILPGADAWEAQSEGQLRPSGRWISAAISRAVEGRAGLLFVHSHPDAAYPLGFSALDERSIRALAETIGPILEGPFAAAVEHPAGWAALVSEGDQLVDVASITAIGRTLRVLSPMKTLPRRRQSDPPGLDDRQRDALGVVHDVLQHLHVAVVGAGGVGSPVAEQLYRMGAGSLTLVDHDRLDTPSNARRVVGSMLADLRAAVAPAKVDVVGRHLDQIGLGPPVRRLAGDVRREQVFRELLDVDVVICATDSHSSRAVLNELASTYLLPVIDVGVQAGAKRGDQLAGLVAEVAILTPTTPCLWCRERISGDVIREEHLPVDQQKRLAEEGYLVGQTGAPAPSVMALTALAGGMATCALLGLLSSEGEVAPSGYWIDGLMGDSRETRPTEPNAGCRCRNRIGRGDTAAPPFLDPRNTPGER